MSRPDEQRTCPSLVEELCVAFPLTTPAYEQQRDSMSNGLDDRRMWPSLVEELCVAFPITDPVSTRASLQDAPTGDVEAHTSLQDVLSTEADTRTSLQDVSPTMGEFPLCGMCNDDYPPPVPIGGCGKTCCNDTGVIESCSNEVTEHDAGAIDLIDPLMPDVEFDEPVEFALLQAQNADSRRATYGINGAAPGVQVSGSEPIKSGSKPFKSRSRPSKTDETTSYNKPVGNIITHADSAATGLSPS